MKKPEFWINPDYADVDDEDLSLSISVQIEDRETEGWYVLVVDGNEVLIASKGPFELEADAIMSGKELLATGGGLPQSN